MALFITQVCCHTALIEIQPGLSSCSPCSVQELQSGDWNMCRGRFKAPRAPGWVKEPAEQWEGRPLPGCWDLGRGRQGGSHRAAVRMGGRAAVGSKSTSESTETLNRSPETADCGAWHGRQRQELRSTTGWKSCYQEVLGKQYSLQLPVVNKSGASPLSSPS